MVRITLCRWIVLALLISPGIALGQSIFTVAGGGSDDGLPATEIGLFGPRGMALDEEGNLYFAEQFSNLVRKIEASSRTIFTVAGNGGSGFSGDDGPATEATLASPRAVAVSEDGEIYIADHDNGRVRKVDEEGIITTIAGKGEERPDGTLGDNGQALEAVLRGPSSLWLDGSTLYVTEDGFLGNRLRKIDLSTGIITTLAGALDGSDGFAGDGQQATASTLNAPEAVITDSAGNIFIADAENLRVRRIDAVTGIIETYAGGGSPPDGRGDGGLATSAALDFTTALAFDPAGNLLVLTFAGLRRIDRQSRIISTVSNGLGAAYGLAVGEDGTIFTNDSSDNIVTIAPGSSEIVRYAGGGTFVGDGRDARAAVLRSPQGLAIDGEGHLFIADRASTRVRRVDAETGVITTYAGNGLFYDDESDNGKLATEAPMGAVSDIAFDSQDNLYVADTNNFRVRRIDAVTKISTFFAGGGDPPGGVNEGLPATAARLQQPVGLGVDAAGNVYIADSQANRIWKVDAVTRTIATFAGNGTEGYSGDNGLAVAASLRSPNHAVPDNVGNVFISDTGNDVIRKVAPDGRITTYAGLGPGGQTSGDGGLATQAGLSPLHLAIHDLSGDLFVADGYSSRIRRIDAGSEIISTFAGSGTAYFIDADFSGDGGPATDAKLNFSFELGGIGIEESGDVYISDSKNNRVRAVFACVSVAAPLLSVPSDGATSVSTAPALTWSQPGFGVFRYDVLLDTVSPPLRVVAEDVGETTSFTPSNLQPATKYFWRIVAIGDPFCTPVSTATSAIATFTTSGVCGAGAFDAIAPQDGAANVASPVQLSWQSSSGAGSYDLYLGPLSPPPVVARGLTQTSFTTNLDPGRYNWFVLAHAACDDSETAATPIRSFTVQGTPTGCVPNQIQIQTTAPVNGATDVPTTTELTWSATGAITAYDLYFGTASDPPLLDANLSETRQTVRGLTSGTKYFWRVVARSSCDPAGISSQTVSFTTRACSTPGTTSIVFAPASVTAGSTYTIVWSPAPGLDADGAYLIDRSVSPTFATITDAQITTSIAASFVAGSTTTYYHRVRAVPACDPTKSGPVSDVRSVSVTTARANVVFTVQPVALVTALGESLEDKRGSFALENIGSDSLQVIVGRQELNGSQPFFSVIDPAGSDVAFVTLEPRRPRVFEIRYSGPPNNLAAAYQGVIFVASTGQGLSVTPYAFVNLKVGGGVAATPEFVVSGAMTDYVAFPGFPGDDSGRPALTISVRNPGPTPMELAAEIGPEVWLLPEPSWNATALAPGAVRSIALFSRRSRAPNGSALPRYTYFTVRTKDGATARLLVQDNDLLSVTSGRSIRLDLGIRSFIVPEVVSRTTSTGAPLVSRIRLSNVGADAVQAELIFTPAGTDGFLASAVRRAVVVAPPNDVVTLTDPLAQIFGLARPVRGQLEVRLPRERLGQVGVTASIVVLGGSGGFSIPAVNRGDGARAGAPHVLLGVTASATMSTALTLAETGGIDRATIRATLYDAAGTRIGEAVYPLQRYGFLRVDKIVPELGGSTIDNGRIELTVDSGGGSVVALGTLTSGNEPDTGAVALSQSAGEATTGTALRRAFLESTATPPTIVTVVPVIPSSSSPGMAPAYRTSLGFVAPRGAAVNFTAVFRPASAPAAAASRTISVPAGTTRLFPDGAVELFQLASGAAGSVFVESPPGGKVYAVLLATSGATPTVPSGFLPLPTTLSEVLTSATSSGQRPLFFDGMEQSIDSSRGTRWQLILNEVAGATGTLNIRLYEAGNRNRSIAERELPIGAYQQLRLDTVFGELGLDSIDRRKDRTNVQVVVTASAGSARVAATAVSIDNRTGDTKVFALAPSVGSATPSVSLAAPVLPAPPSGGRRRAVRR